jgi:hypothetical protein
VPVPVPVPVYGKRARKTFHDGRLRASMTLVTLRDPRAPSPHRGKSLVPELRALERVSMERSHTTTCLAIDDRLLKEARSVCARLRH